MQWKIDLTTSGTDPNVSVWDLEKLTLTEYSEELHMNMGIDIDFDKTSERESLCQNSTI